MASQYTLRRATAADIDRIATVYSSAFRHDPVVQSFVTYSPELASEYRQHFVYKTRWRLLLPGWVIYVAVHKETGEIDGLATWERRGNSVIAKSWQTDSWTNWILRIYEKFAKKFRSDPVYNAEVHNYISTQAHSAVDEEHPDRWELHALAVAPERQRRGIGGLLLGWGIGQGQKEGVPVALEASPGGFGLYSKAGFEVVNTIKITEAVEFPVMVWTPKRGSGGSSGFGNG